MWRGLRVVDPYGPYGWNRSFSIRTRSENRISLRGLRIFSKLYRCGTWLRVVDPYGPYGWNRSFSIRLRSENCISLRELRICSRLYRCGGGYGLSIRTVRTDGIGRFQSVHDRKIASH